MWKLSICILLIALATMTARSQSTANASLSIYLADISTVKLTPYGSTNQSTEKSIQNSLKVSSGSYPEIKSSNKYQLIVTTDTLGILNNKGCLPLAYYPAAHYAMEKQKKSAKKSVNKQLIVYHVNPY
jgi:hypothetical protein